METPTGVQQIISLFGEAGQPRCHSGVVTLSGRGRIVCHELLEETLQSVFDKIFSECAEYYLSCGGCYANRAKRGSHKISTHAWGIAVDLNVPYNPLSLQYEQLLSRYSKDKLKYIFTPTHPIVKIFEEHGFLWGGDFKGRKDGMHFQFAKGY